MPIVSFALATALLAGRLGILGWLHKVSDRHPVREAVSDYGVGRTAGTFRLLGALTAAAWLALAVGTWFGYPDWSFRLPATLMLAGIAVLTVLTALVPTDLEGEKLTLRGGLHYLFAIASFGLSYSLTGDISRMMFTGHPMLVALHWVALVSLILLCVCLVPRLRRWFGLFERVFLISITLFFAVYAIASLLG
ncbi:hypothetical protein CGZ93_06440 [Enemella dayhoffiae]|uniref:DUF998 domain-containing protein n=1 Tax=Enemella dayhoffiae TaxID=2016507 RepID=A0A255H689_9ACTN|nr:DUF998 domain-containing protein [Enemella dayhoffiae]OYO23097.1 hypothetical protein CGZ93_06440 [Enemella dayhoffiae]